MTAQVLEAVPNFSEGRDLAVVEAIVAAMRDTGADVLDWSADPDHHRSVVTVAGPPNLVEDAAVAGARVAFERIDLRKHQGVHPRVGALDVLPFVPLAGLTLEDARFVARRAGRRIARELGVPVFYYGQASDPPGRPLQALRSGGYERLVERWPADRIPDVLPDDYAHPGAHPTAGVACVGARRVLLAWNVLLDGLSLDAARAVARDLRETRSGLRGVRALALWLPTRGRLQLSMNLEDPEVTAPADVFAAVESLVAGQGGRVVETEIIGMVPDALLASAADRYYRLEPGTTERMLSHRLVEHLAARNDSPVTRDE